MGIVIRHSARNLILTYTGFLIGFVSTLWLYPLAMTKEQIGLVRLLINVSWLLSAMVSLGAISIPNRFFPYFSGSVKQRKEFTSFVLVLGLIGYLIFLILASILRETIVNIYRLKAPLLADYLPFFLILTFVVLAYSIIDALAVVQHESNAATFAKELLIRTLLALALVALAMKVMSFKMFVICTVVAYVSQFLFLFIYLIRKRKFALTFNISFIRNEKFGEMLTYGGFVVLGSATGFLMSSLDGLMLSAYEGLGSTGIYTVAYFIATIVDGPRRSLSQAIIPHISKANKENDFTLLKSLYQKSSLNQLITGGGLFLLIWLNIDSIFRIIPHGEIYASGKWVVFYIGLAKLFDMATGANAEIVTTSRYYKLDLFFFVGMGLLGILWNILLIPRYGIMGAAMATAISIFLVNILRTVVVLLYFKMLPFTFSTLKVVAVGLISIVTCNLVPVISSPFFDIALKSFVFVGVFGTLLISSQASEDINGLLKKLLGKYISLNG